MWDIFGIPARDLAAYWGAGLATLLAAVKLLHPRPTVTLRAVKSIVNDPDFKLKVTNNGTYPLVLSKIHMFGAQGAIQTGSIDGWEVKDVATQALTDRMDIVIEPGGTFEVSIVSVPKPTYLVLVLTWRSHRMISWPLFPSILIRGAASVRALLEHPAPEKL
ncbi:MAG: hypothetical protein PS018_20205 [bacterium]|nr:hypothetical protein [bacterium]